MIADHDATRDPVVDVVEGDAPAPFAAETEAGAAVDPLLRSTLDLVEGARFRLVEPGYDPAAVDQLLEEVTGRVIGLAEGARTARPPEPEPSADAPEAPVEPAMALEPGDDPERVDPADDAPDAAQLIADAQAEARAILDDAEARAIELVAAASRSMLAAFPEGEVGGEGDALPEAPDPAPPRPRSSEPVVPTTPSSWPLLPTVAEIRPGQPWGEGEGIAVVRGRVDHPDRDPEAASGHPGAAATPTADVIDFRAAADTTEVLDLRGAPEPASGAADAALAAAAPGPVADGPERRDGRGAALSDEDVLSSIRADDVAFLEGLRRAVHLGLRTDADSEDPRLTQERP